MLKSILTLWQRPWFERYFAVLLLVAGAGAAAICLLIGAGQSVWFDEAYSILVAKQPVGELLELTAADTHPPFYYLLLKTWATLFGWSELALRSLSALAAGGAVVMAGLLIKRFFGVRAALIALCFVAVAPFLLRYGFEIRMYALASLIGISATYILLVALQAKGRLQWVLYGLYAVLVALGTLTLYYLALLWIAHLAWLVWRAKRATQPIVKTPWAAAYAASLVLFLPWLPVFVAQTTNGALAPISQAMTLDNLLGIVSFSFVYQPVWQLGAIVSLIVLFVLIALGYFMARAFKHASRQEKPYLQLLAMYIAVPIAVITLISLVRPMYVERYLAHVLIGGMALVGVAVAIVTRQKDSRVRLAGGLLFAALLVGVAQLSVVGNYNFQRLQKPAIDSIAAAIKPCNQDSVVLAADPYMAIELSYYLPDCTIHFYSQQAKLTGGYAPLSESPLRVSDPATELAHAKEITYVHYDEPQLQLPNHVTEKSRHTQGALSAVVFIAK